VTWYVEVAAKVREVTQGELVPGCVLYGWVPDADLSNLDFTKPVTLVSAVGMFRQDCIVLTQACDLAERKVQAVVLCAAYPISVYRAAWEDKYPGQSFKNHYEAVRNGKIHSLYLLPQHESTTAAQSEVRFVNFADVYTLPLPILEEQVRARHRRRIRLNDVERIRLSRRFAEFFGRAPGELLPKFTDDLGHSAKGERSD